MPRDPAVPAHGVVLAVPPAAAGTRLDRFLASLPALATRSQAKQAIDAGMVLVDGERRKPAYPLRPGERVTVALVARPAPGVEAEPLPLTVLYEDADLLAIDKPAGMVVHPAAGVRRGTVVNALLHRLGVGGPGEPERAGIVHRLDRHTSGVLLVARTAAALAGLAAQFRDRRIAKRYLAVVHGRVTAAAGTVDRPIGRHPRDRKRMSVHTRRGRRALTRWQVLERFPNATLVGLAPETGRTHQLRVHLAAMGHPIVGDRVYGTRGRGRRRGDEVLQSFPRQALHAEELRFVHPRTGAVLTVRAPVPPDLEALLAELRQGSGTAGKSSRSA